MITNPNWSGLPPSSVVYCVLPKAKEVTHMAKIKKYHLLLKDMKWLSTRKTGYNEDNIKGFIATLQASVEKIRVTE